MCPACFRQVNMERVEHYQHPVTQFVFDLEFIGDVRKLSSCYIWEVAVYCVQTQQWFEAVVDPSPSMNTFPPPPIPEIPQLTRSFLNNAAAKTWDVVFQELLVWVATQSGRTTPMFISHNTFRADKPILELECRRYEVHMPLHWFFFDSLHFSRRVVRNTNGNYSLSGLHEQIFGQSIQNAHRARNDVVACMAILNHLTSGSWSFQGPMYPTYCTALRTIRWIGQKAEEILFKCNIRSVEELYTFLLKEARSHYVQQGLDFGASVQTTLFRCFGDQLPSDNIRNIAAVLASAKKCVYCHTFMEPVGLRCDSPSLK